MKHYKIIFFVGDKGHLSATQLGVKIKDYEIYKGQVIKSRKRERTTVVAPKSRLNLDYDCLSEMK